MRVSWPTHSCRPLLEVKEALRKVPAASFSQPVHSRRKPPQPEPEPELGSPAAAVSLKYEVVQKAAPAAAFPRASRWGSSNEGAGGKGFPGPKVKVGEWAGGCHFDNLIPFIFNKINCIIS